MEKWKPLRASHFSTPPTATRYQQNSPRYTNNEFGTKDRADQGELGLADSIKVDAWLSEMPLLKESYDLLQNLYVLYRSKTTPEEAATLLNGWFDELSPDALSHMMVFVDLVRGHITDVCAFWPWSARSFAPVGLLV